MRVLLVEDDEHLARAVQRGLQEEGYVVDHAPTGPDARLLAETRHYDLIVLDRMLPEVSGDELLAGWRRQRVTTPILMLTALDAISSRVTGLRAGADDYMVKPFAFEELLARLEALARRASTAAGSGAFLRAGDLTLNLETGDLESSGGTVRLSAQEFRLLEFFLRHPGQILTRRAIVDACWQDPVAITDNALDAQIKNLRKRLNAVSPRAWLQTRRGLGYVLEADPNDLS